MHGFLSCGANTDVLVYGFVEAPFFCFANATYTRHSFILHRWAEEVEHWYPFLEPSQIHLIRGNKDKLYLKGVSRSVSDGCTAGCVTNMGWQEMRWDGMTRSR